MRYVYSVLLGVLGFSIAWGGWHLYTDHEALHALINLAVQAQRAQVAPAQTGK